MSLDEDDRQDAGPWGRLPTRRDNPRFGRRLLILAAVATALLALLFWQFPPAQWRESDNLTFVRMSLIGTLVLMSLAASQRSFATMASQLSIWAGIAIVIVALYGYRYELRDVWQRVAGEFLPTHGQELADGAMVFTRAPNGHFWIDATVNGVSVRFLVDTGASDVVLNREDAARLGIVVDASSFTQRAQTANGTTRGAPVRLRQIRIGQIRFDDVPAMVNEGELRESLLGMHLLERLSSIEIRNDRLTIRP
jgi:aspartyl protease family protein